MKKNIRDSDDRRVCRLYHRIYGGDAVKPTRPYFILKPSLRDCAGSYRGKCGGGEFSAGWNLFSATMRGTPPDLLKAATYTDARILRRPVVNDVVDGDVLRRITCEKTDKMQIAQQAESMAAQHGKLREQIEPTEEVIFTRRFLPVCVLRKQLSFISEQPQRVYRGGNLHADRIYGEVRGVYDRYAPVFEKDCGRCGRQIRYRRRIR